MRLLANENFPAPSVRHLRDLGYDVVFVAEGGGGLGDRGVLTLAVEQGRWILTFDRDYGELIFARGAPAPPSIVLFRLRSYRPETPARLLAEVLTAGAADFEGNFVLVEDAGLRIRPLPHGSVGG